MSFMIPLERKWKSGIGYGAEGVVGLIGEQVGFDD